MSTILHLHVCVYMNNYVHAQLYVYACVYVRVWYMFIYMFFDTFVLFSYFPYGAPTC